MNSLSDSMWLKGNTFSLHSLQNQVVLFWTKRKSSCNKDVQFLCTFLWQHWHRTTYEFRNIFLLHIGQMLIRSFITDRTLISLKTMGALVCMSRRDMPVCPGDVIICRWACAEPGSGLFAVHCLPHDVTFSIHRWCQAPPCGGTWRMFTSRSSGQNELRPWPRYCFILCKHLMSPNSFLCI